MKIRIAAVLFMVLTLTLIPDSRGQESDPNVATEAQQKALASLASANAAKQQRLEKLHELLLEKSQRLMGMSEKLGDLHPEMIQLKEQIAEIEIKVATDARVFEFKIAESLSQQMQQVADAMEALGNQLDRIERLENELHSEVVPSRKPFFDSVEKMFTSGKDYFRDLEQAIDVAQAAGEGIIRSNVPASSEEIQFAEDKTVQSDDEFAKLRAEESRQRAVEAYLAAVHDKMAADANPASGRLEKVEERLSRIESLLEQLNSKNNDHDK